jgi:hypothetical protein
MATYGVFFADPGDGAGRYDDESLVLDEECGWGHRFDGSAVEVLEWIVDEFNDEDLPDASGHWMRVVKYTDNTIVDGEQVVL